MTEHKRKRIARAPSRLQIAASKLEWDGDALQIAVDEICAPLPRRIRGCLSVRPAAFTARALCLAERHHWQPIAPRARIEVRLDEPRVVWQGDAYFDSNWGGEPLEAAFGSWQWSRRHAGNATVIAYDTLLRAGREQSLALKISGDGSIEALPLEPALALPATLWRIPRQVRSAVGVLGLQTLEDTPFYARSLLGTEQGDMMHESLSLTRLVAPLTRAMLPFRMPRAFF
jgi:carotenoid 1,2-hydratase